jgi:hypothetical protein
MLVSSHLLSKCCAVLIPLLGDGVDRVDDPRKVAEDGEQEAEPELDLEARHRNFIRWVSRQQSATARQAVGQIAGAA